jgi:hypothetical protein
VRPYREFGFHFDSIKPTQVTFYVDLTRLGDRREFFFPTVGIDVELLGGINNFTSTGFDARKSMS